MSSHNESLAGQTADVDPLDLVSGDGTTEKRRTAPIAHGAGISIVLDDDVDLYDSLRSTWRESVGEAGGEALVDAESDWLPDGDYVWRFFSSNWKAGQENANGTWKRWYDYQIRLRRREEDPETGDVELVKPPVSLSVIVEPQVEGLSYKDGGDVTLPYGEGSRLRIKSTYVERSSTIVSRGLSAVSDVLESEAPDDVDVDRLARARDIKQESGDIYKAEAYLRFDIDRKHAAVRALDKSEDLVDVGGASEIETHKKRQEEGWLEARVSSDRWDRLGLDPLDVDSGARAERELKVYQRKDWASLPDSHYAKHPKIEASLDGGAKPDLSEWDDVIQSLRELVLAHCEWAGIDDDDLLGDDYFRPGSQPSITYQHPEGRREDLRSYYERFEVVATAEALKHETDAIYDILCVLSEQYGATYDELVDATGFCRSNVQYHVGRLKDMGLLTTVGNPAIVCFDAKYLYEQCVELVEQQLAPHFEEETLSSRRRGREERARERREARENGEAAGTDASPADTDVDGSQGSSTDDDDRFVYLKDWDHTPQTMIDQLVDGDHPRDERDIRVRLLGD